MRVGARAWMAAGGAVTGIAALASGPWASTGARISDLLTGSVLMICGIVATTLEPRTRAGLLLFAAGVAWFLPDLWAVPEAVQATSVSLIYLHRAVIIHLLLSFPTGRISTGGGWLAVIGSYVVSILTPVWSTPLTAGAFGLVIAIAATARYARSSDQLRGPRGVAAWCSAVLATAIVTAAVVRTLAPTPALTVATLHFYEVTLMATSVALLISIAADRRRRQTLGDLVIVVDPKAGSGLQAGLVWALGDPGLRLRGCPPGEFAAAPPLSGPAPGSREITTVRRADGSPVAVVEHAPGLLADPRLRASVFSAVLLDTENHQLNEVVSAQVADVQAARGRLLDAEDEEGRRLDLRLRHGAGRRLQCIADTVAELEAADPSRASSLAEVREALDSTSADLSALAHGLYPSILLSQGLAAAVRGMARSMAPLPVEATLEVDDLATAGQLTVYFCLSEALSNVVKHAAAHHAWVSVVRDEDVVLIEVRDDGVGGASPGAGRGLTNLIDRVSARGGTMEVASPPGGGTILRIRLPIRSAEQTPS